MKQVRHITLDDRVRQPKGAEIKALKSLAETCGWCFGTGFHIEMRFGCGSIDGSRPAPLFTRKVPCICAAARRPA